MPIMGYWLCFSGRTCLRLTGHTDTHNITIPSQTGLSNFTELGWGSLEIKFGLKSPISKRCYWHRISLLSNHEILENNSQFSKAIVFSQLGWLTWALFHKTLKTSLHRLTGLCKDIFMFYETEPWWMVNMLQTLILTAAWPQQRDRLICM